MEEIELDDQQQRNSRPVFLTVLCILSFIGSGLGLLSGISSSFIFPPRQLYKQMIEASEVTGGILPPFEEFVQWSQYNTIVSTVAALIGLIAAVMMWKLIKSGYFLYIFSWVATIVMSIISVPHIADSVTIGFTWIAVIINIVIMAAFVIMYGVNLKHMK